jgi:hypothetical protein
MSEFDDRGKVALWKSDIDHPKAPVAHGTVYAHRDIKEGEKLAIALWRSDSDHPRAPLMIGKISDPYKEQDQQDSHPPPAGGFKDFKDDDIPF